MIVTSEKPPFWRWVCTKSHLVVWLCKAKCKQLSDCDKGITCYFLTLKRSAQACIMSRNLREKKTYWINVFLFHNSVLMLLLSSLHLEVWLLQCHRINLQAEEQGECLTVIMKWIDIKRILRMHRINRGTADEFQRYVNDYLFHGCVIIFFFAICYSFRVQFLANGKETENRNCLAVQSIHES